MRVENLTSVSTLLSDMFLSLNCNVQRQVVVCHSYSNSGCTKSTVRQVYLVKPLEHDC